MVHHSIMIYASHHKCPSRMLGVILISGPSVSVKFNGGSGRPSGYLLPTLDMQHICGASKGSSGYVPYGTTMVA